MKKTKIVATIGPACQNKEVLRQIIDAGINVARLNFSHGDHEEQLGKIKLLREFMDAGENIAILLDTKGPEIRSGDFENGCAAFVKGDIARISMTPVLGTKELFSTTHTGLYDDMNVNDVIKFDDGRLAFKVVSKDEEQRHLVVEAQNNHVIKNKRNCIAPFGRLSVPFISEKDYQDLVFGCVNEVDYVATSFTRRADDVRQVREILDKYSPNRKIQIIAKIENQEGVDNIDEILDVADGLMVARGDLGVELPPEDVPIVQKMLVKKAKRRRKVSIVATHMLDSMCNNPTPTRAEVSDVANAIMDGCDAIMLSGETANGEYPVEAVLMQASIARKIESFLDYHTLAEEGFALSNQTASDAIAFSVANTTLLTDAKLIVSFSFTGNTTRRMSSYRPECPIITVTPYREVLKATALHWGVYGVLNDKTMSTVEEFEQKAIEVAKELKIPNNSSILITGGDPVTGSTNFMKICKVVY